jgi:carbon storage regulator CsrA
VGRSRAAKSEPCSALAFIILDHAILTGSQRTRRLLALYLNLGDSIFIGDLCVTVIGIFSKKVHLGIANLREKSGFLTSEGKPNEKIFINENVKIKVLKIGERRVRLGVEAPPEVLVLRDKLVSRDSQERT